MSKTTVSIITPTYNSADYIEDTIKSIQSQSFRDWELLITDDCSVDDTVSIVKSYIEQDPRIKLFQLDVNSGGGVARNNSIKEASGRYIAFCDSDDRWVPNKLEKQVQFMQEKQCGLSYSSYYTCTEAGEKNGIVICKEKETYGTIKIGDGIGCLTAMYDTEVVGKVYLPIIRKRQDWGLMIRVLAKCMVAYGIKEPLGIYRLRSNSISSKKLNLVKYNIQLYQDVLGWSRVHAILFFLVVFMPNHLLKVFKRKIVNLKYQKEIN